MSWRRRGYGRGYGNVRRKVLIGLLALGTLVGYGSGFAHMAGHCRRAREWDRRHDCPCEHEARWNDRGPPGPEWDPRQEAWGPPMRNWR